MCCSGRTLSRNTVSSLLARASVARTIKHFLLKALRSVRQNPSSHVFVVFGFSEHVQGVLEGHLNKSMLSTPNTLTHRQLRPTRMICMCTEYGVRAHGFVVLFAVTSVGLPRPDCRPAWKPISLAVRYGGQLITQMQKQTSTKFLYRLHAATTLQPNVIHLQFKS